MEALMNNKKGLIFALDAALAVTVVVLMVINSTYYFSISSKGSLSHLQSTKLASDIVAVLDQGGTFANIVYDDSKNPPSNVFEITPAMLNLSTYLPANYQLWMSLSDVKETVIPAFAPVAGAPCFPAVPTTFYFANAEPLQREIKAMLQLNVTVINSGSVALSSINLGQITPFSVSQSGLYTLGPFKFMKGTNGVTIVLDPSFVPTGQPQNVCIHWFRILGTEEYAGSTNETMYIQDLFPKDRFIGSGERVIGVKKSGNFTDNPYEGTHLLRYRVWLKGGS
jgi:hypothetical protein